MCRMELITVSAYRVLPRTTGREHRGLHGPQEVRLSLPLHIPVCHVQPGFRVGSKRSFSGSQDSSLNSHTQQSKQAKPGFSDVVSSSLLRKEVSPLPSSTVMKKDSCWLRSDTSREERVLEKNLFFYLCAIYSEQNGARVY